MPNIYKGESSYCTYCHMLATIVQAGFAEWSLSVLKLFGLGREVICDMLQTVVSVRTFVYLPFMAATSHVAFEKLSIHF